MNHRNGHNRKGKPPKKTIRNKGSLPNYKRRGSRDREIFDISDNLDKIGHNSFIDQLISNLTTIIDETYKGYKGKNLNIEEYLQKYGDILASRGIVGDILFDSKTGSIRLKCKYGLSITVNNIHSLLKFCSIHGFLPVIDKIFIDNKDIADITEIYNFLIYSICASGNPVIINTLFNEIERYKRKYKRIETLFGYLGEISEHVASTTQYILGDKLEKMSNSGTLSENLFIEVAMRIENSVRKILGINSSYILPASYEDDIKHKTDMIFIKKITEKDKYQEIPIQFTIGKKIGKKENDVESYLKSYENRNMQGNFIILSVGGQFYEEIVFNNLLGQYNKWLNNPKKREEDSNKNKNETKERFPLFIDHVESQTIQPAEIIYIALNILCKRHKFIRYKNKGYIWDKKHEDFLYDNGEKVKINGITLSKIDIELDDDVTIPYKLNEQKLELKKQRFKITYSGKDIGRIVIYGK